MVRVPDLVVRQPQQVLITAILNKVVSSRSLFKVYEVLKLFCWLFVTSWLPWIRNKFWPRKRPSQVSCGGRRTPLKALTVNERSSEAKRLQIDFLVKQICLIPCRRSNSRFSTNRPIVRSHWSLISGIIPYLSTNKNRLS